MFAYGHAAAATWRECVAACAERLGRPGRGLGFVYFTDPLVSSAPQILQELQERTGVENWVGSVGLGVLATGAEYQEEPAMAAMVADIDGFKVFSGRAPLKGGHFAVVHADPSAPDVPGLVADRDPWAGRMPAPQRLPADLVAEGHTIPVARVQAMHEGKRRARAGRTFG